VDFVLSPPDQLLPLLLDHVGISVNHSIAISFHCSNCPP
jgi:hypothetical protein